MGKGTVKAKRSAQINVKYALDRVVGGVLLLSVAPLFAAIGAAIKLDDGGPVFFRHERPGLGGRPFRVWKFRTMIVNADSFLDKEGRVGEVNRITRVGRMLRFSSLDELPQLINIVRGQMSIVGPRPAMMDHLQRYTDEQMGRFRMRPGVTGMAQINGRNTLKWSKRIEYDNAYIERYSLLLDVSILLKTVRVVALREGIVLDRNQGQVDDLATPDEEGRP